MNLHGIEWNEIKTIEWRPNNYCVILWKIESNSIPYIYIPAIFRTRGMEAQTKTATTTKTIFYAPMNLIRINEIAMALEVERFNQIKYIWRRKMIWVAACSGVFLYHLNVAHVFKISCIHESLKAKNGDGILLAMACLVAIRQNIHTQKKNTLLFHRSIIISF